MATLNPGSTSESRRSDRLVVELVVNPGQGAMCRVATRELQFRQAGNRWIVEAAGSNDGEATVSIVATTSGSTMRGSVSLVVLAIPHDGDGGNSRQEWNVDGVVVEGRSTLEILRFRRTSRGTWELENLLSAIAPLPTSTADSGQQSLAMNVAASPLTQAALREWGDRPRIDTDVVVAVDRSASMAWAFSSKAVEKVLDLIAANAEAALSRESRVRYLTYGSALDKSHLQVLTLERVPDGIQGPDMYSSTADPAYTALAKQNAAIYVLVTDEAPGQESHALLTENGCHVFTLVLHGGDSELEPMQLNGTHSVGFPPSDGEPDIAALPEQSAQSVLQFLSNAFEIASEEQGVVDASVE